MNDELRIAKINRQIERERAQTELLRTIVSNPVVELVAGISILEYLNRKGYINDFSVEFTETAVFASVAFQQLSPLIPLMIQSGMAKEIVGKFPSIPSLPSLPRLPGF